MKSEIRRIEDLTGGEFSKQPIEPERIFREGEMGDRVLSVFVPLRFRGLRRRDAERRRIRQRRAAGVLGRGRYEHGSFAKNERSPV